MCCAGTSGERMWATSEMPLAQNRGSSLAPGMSLRNSAENSPSTVEMLTPTFSKTRPRMIEIVPPPPPGRCQLERSKRPAGPSVGRSPANSSSIASNAEQIRSRSSANQVSAAAQRIGSGGKAATSVIVREQLGLAQRLGERDGAGKGDVERSGRRAQGDDHAGSRTLMDVLGHARTLAAEQDRVAGGKRETVEGRPPRCRHQNDARARVTIAEECGPREVPANPQGRRIVERSTLEAPVVKQEAARLDQIDRDAEAGGKTKQRPGILGYVRLIQGEAQTTSKHSATTRTAA